MQRLFYYKLVNAATQQTILFSLTCFFDIIKPTMYVMHRTLFLVVGLLMIFGGLKGSINFSFGEAFYVLDVNVTVIV